MIRIKIAFTGRRKINNCYDYKKDNYWIKTIKPIFDYLLDIVKEEDIHFITGGALGIDLAMGELTEFLKTRTSKKITTELALPNIRQGENWFGESIEILKYLKNNVDKLTIVNELEEYKTDNIYKQLDNRNKYMISQCDLLIAVWDNIEKGGTWNAIKYAKSINKKILYFKIAK